MLHMVKQVSNSSDLGDGTAALAKGIGLLRAIVSDGGVTGVGDLGAGLGLSRSTVHRLLAELQRQGLVMRTRRGRYRPGLGLMAMASGLTMDDQLAEAARQPLQDLVRLTGLTAHFGVLQGDMVTYLVKAPASQCALIFTRERTQLEAYCSGIGKMLLACLPREGREAYLAGGSFVALTPHTLINPQDLRTKLEAARLNDFATDEQEIVEGLRCIAVPVRGVDGTVMAAISVSMTRADSPPADDELLRCLRMVSAQIGRRLVAGPS